MSNSLSDRISSDLRDALKARDEPRIRTLRGLKAALQSKELEKGRGSLSESDAEAVVHKQARQRKDSLEQFRLGGREDLAAREQEELDIIQAYLPEELSDAEIETIIGEAVDSMGATSLSDMGKVMGLVMPKIKGRADGNRVREHVVRRLKS